MMPIFNDIISITWTINNLKDTCISNNICLFYMYMQKASIESRFKYTIVRYESLLLNTLSDDHRLISNHSTSFFL